MLWANYELHIGMSLILLIISVLLWHFLVMMLSNANLYVTQLCIN